jgi:hypothetical protein
VQPIVALAVPFSCHRTIAGQQGSEPLVWIPAKPFLFSVCPETASFTLIPASFILNENRMDKGSESIATSHSFSMAY